jgi:hypothetical protein
MADPIGEARGAVKDDMTPKRVIMSSNFEHI